jgi:predicted nucleic acid-binding protein
LIALDTNILAYAVTAQDIKNRHEIALEILQKLASPGAIVPLPVIGEFFNACRKKNLASPELVATRVALWLDVYECPAATAEDYLEAACVSAEFNLQYFDALIIAVAARAGATMLLSEDMHDGLVAGGLRVVNPFAAGNDALLADYFAARV